MGARQSVDASYTLGKPFECKNNFWKIYPAVRKVDDVSVTVFIHDIEESSNFGNDKAVKYMHTLRHPGIVKCLEVFENTDEVTVVTEPVVPLNSVINELDCQELIAGIHGIIKTTAFLHDKCKLSHNNLSMGVIFVGQNDASWKIAGFECMCSFGNMSKELLAEIEPYRDAESVPPEGENSNLSFPHAQDCFGMARLILDILNQAHMEDEAVIDVFRQRLDTELLSSDNQEIPQVSCLLRDEVFQNGYVEILDFLRNITVKTTEEKAVFFRHLHHRLADLPASMVANRLLHLLLSRFVLVDPVAVEFFLPHLLTPASGNHCIENHQHTDIVPLLPEELYRKSCVPILGKLFEVNDRHVRLILLRYFHLYVSMFENSFLKDVILHQLLAGLRESDDELVSATFSALQYLVPLLGSKIVIGGERTQQFTERRPKFDSQNTMSGVEKAGDQPRKTDITSAPSTRNANECENAEKKMKDRERRRQEARRRNEERRKQKQLLRKKKFLPKKDVIVEAVEDASDDDFDSWGDLAGERDQNIEVSDGSEQGRPSSSEISLDSGFSETNHVPPVQPAAPTTLREKSQKIPETNTRKPFSGRTGSGMKLGKTKQSSKKENHPGAVSSSCVPVSMDNDNVTSGNPNITVSKNITTKNSPKNKTISNTQCETSGENLPRNFGEDLFADMAPSFSKAPEVPVKGTSVYSDKLAVDNETGEIADAWTDEGW